MHTDPARRIGHGVSSRGIRAFRLAWHRPDRFGGVPRGCGSFTGVGGAHSHPHRVWVVRRTPMQACLQDGAGDVGHPYRSWPDANRALAKSLALAGYGAQLASGTGSLDLRHGDALFADALRGPPRPAR